MFSALFLMVQITDTFTNKFTTKILDLVLSMSASYVCGVELIILSLLTSNFLTSSEIAILLRQLNE